MRLTIIDRTPGRLDSFQFYFRGDYDVDCTNIDIANADLKHIEALVTPGNSFGLMDGGFDQAVLNRFGAGIQTEIRKQIEFYHSGELHVGTAVDVATAGPAIIYAPTMRVPMTITRTDNVYLAMRAALLQAKAIGCDTMMCPVLGTGAGNMPAKMALKQMKLAWDSMTRKMPERWSEADEVQGLIGLGHGGDPDHW